MGNPGEDEHRYVHADGMDVADLGQRAVAGCCQRAHALSEQCGWCLLPRCLEERSAWFRGDAQCESGDENRGYRWGTEGYTDANCARVSDI